MYKNGQQIFIITIITNNILVDPVAFVSGTILIDKTMTINSPKNSLTAMCVYAHIYIHIHIYVYRPTHNCQAIFCCEFIVL